MLCLQPQRIDPLAADLADRLRPYSVDAVCGPLNEGAFVALLVASRLGVEFSYAERVESSSQGDLFPVQYRIPTALRTAVHGRRVAIVNDVINAGSAVRGTYTDLLACGAIPVIIASLLVLGEFAAQFAAENGISLVSLAHRANQIWTPADCPLCAAGVPLSSTRTDSD